MYAKRPGFRSTEWVILVLAVLAGAWGALVRYFVASDEAVFHIATAPAAIIVVLTAVHMWARRTGIMDSSRYLAMFCAMLAVVIAGSGFVLRESAPFSWGELVLGGLLFAVCVYESWISYPSREGMRPQGPRTNV